VGLDRFYLHSPLLAFAAIAAGEPGCVIAGKLADRIAAHHHDSSMAISACVPQHRAFITRDLTR